MSVKTNEEKWREEFEDLERRGLSLTNWRKLNLTPSGKYTLELGKRYETHIAAKTSSYELKETLRKRGNDLAKENVKLQERIKELDKEHDDLRHWRKIAQQLDGACTENIDLKYQLAKLRDHEKKLVEVVKSVTPLLFGVEPELHKKALIVLKELGVEE